MVKMHARTASQPDIDSVVAITWDSQPGVNSGAAITWERPARLAGLTHFQKARQPGSVGWLASCNRKMVL